MIDDAVIRKVLNKALSGGADFAEIFVEDTFNSRMLLNSSRIKQSVSGRDFGIGIRAIYGQTVIYAYTGSLAESRLLETAEAVSRAMSGRGAVQVFDLMEKTVANRHSIEFLPQQIDKSERTALLLRADAAARAFDPRIAQVDSTLAEKVQDIFIANSEGLRISDRRTYTRFALSSVADSGSEKQTGSVSPGGMAGFEFVRNLDIEALAVQAARTAVTMLEAGYAPAGTFPVIIDNGFGGVIFHEACGHALETTAVAKNASVFAGKIGQKIAADCVTAIDDGTLPNEWGSINIDDEGMSTQRTVLIENGILKSFLVDRLGSIQTGYARTGSGRREGYRYAPTSRMRNTFIAPGKESLTQLIESVDFGLYAKTMGGGSVQPGTGDYNFAVTEGYLIRNGKIAEPVRGATLIGNGAETLKQISKVADNFKLAAGMCGSESGSVPTHVGQPAIRVDSMIVGGRSD